MTTQTKRKGARSIKDIPQDILKKLNLGEIETANLMEWLAIDTSELLKNLLNQLKRQDYLKITLSNIDALKKKTINTVNETIGLSFYQLATENNDKDFFSLLSKHTSDSVRCWAAYMIGQNSTLEIAQKLSQTAFFAADSHFGVREVSWLATRPDIAKSLDKSIEILSKWSVSQDENIRRFASEATRPRGVWCEHIEILKKTPALALDILEPLKSDKAKYVQDSVGNWLNDASKTQSEFVKDLCKKWEKESPTKETNYIIKKALRTLQKQ